MVMKFDALINKAVFLFGTEALPFLALLLRMIDTGYSLPQSGGIGSFCRRNMYLSEHVYAGHQLSPSS